MYEDELIIVTYCLVDDIINSLELPQLRKRGYPPALSDSEVITMEI